VVAELSIDTPDNETSFSAAAEVKLKANAHGADATDLKWTRNGVEVGQGTELLLPTGDRRKGSYQVSALIDGARAQSDPVEITVKPADPDSVTPAETEPKAEPPTFHRGFAVAIGLLLLAIGLLFFGTVGPFRGTGSLAQDAWDTLDGRGKLALTIALPMIAIGCLLLLVGLWMAIVEWRGRFRDAPPPPRDEETPRGVIEELPKIIDAVGKLQGAALVLVVGLLALFAAAWVGQAGAGADPAATPTPTPTSAAEPTPNPGTEAPEATPTPT
jgi:hypothetical protein